MYFRSIACFLLILAPAASILAPAASASDVDRYLQDARVEWNSSIADPVDIRMEPMGQCDLSTAPITARTEVSTVETVTTFEDGTKSTSTETRYLIRVNSVCRWNPAWLRNTVLHEYGHVLIGMKYHSTDKHSLMFFGVCEDGKQRIMPADREALARIRIPPLAE